MKTKEIFWLIMVAIISATIFFRFYNYPNRWGLAHDQASFAITARYALSTGSVPLLGPFSSAGPFQTSGMWYWFVMLGTLWNFSLPYAPWVFMTITSILFVWGMYIVGNMFHKRLGVILAALSAVSTAQVTQATNLTNQSPIGFFALATLFFAMLYIRTKRFRYAFLLGLAAGIASSVHLQGVALVLVPLCMFIFVSRKFFTASFFVASGFVLPWLPVVFIDSFRQFTNFKNMYYYITVDQYHIPLEIFGRRWSTFITLFIPRAWAFITGGYVWIGVGLIGLTALAFWYLYKEKKLRKEYTFVLIVTLGLYTVLRYTRTELFESFYVYLHPFVLFLTGLAIDTVFRKNNVVGIGIGVVVTVGSVLVSARDIGVSTNETAVRGARWHQMLKEFFPHDKFLIYDYKFQTTRESLSLVLYLQSSHALDEEGRRIGVAIKTPGELGVEPLFRDNEYAVYDLNGIPKEQLSLDQWGELSPKAIYKSTQLWWEK